MNTIVYDPFRSETPKPHLTGGPRYFAEVLLPHLIKHGSLAQSDTELQTNTYIKYSFQESTSSVSQFIIGARQLRKLDSGIVIPIADDPRALLPCLLASISNHKLELVLPIMHIVRPPTKRPGRFLTNLVAYIWQQCSVWLGALVGSQFVSINEVTHEYLKNRIGLVTRLVGANKSEVYLLKPKSPAISGKFIIPRTRRFAMIGRVIHHKGHSELPLLLRELEHLSGASWQCSVIGDSPAASATQLMSRARKLGVESSITLHGVLSNEERDKVVSSAALLLLLSHEEGYSYVIHDAVAAGKVVVCWDLPELLAVWKDYPNVYFQQIGDIPQMARFIEHLVMS